MQGDADGEGCAPRAATGPATVLGALAGRREGAVYAVFTRRYQPGNSLTQQSTWSGSRVVFRCPVHPPC